MGGKKSRCSSEDELGSARLDAISQMLISHQHISWSTHLGSCWRHNLCEVIADMAESVVTEASLKIKITEQLQATHVAIEDMSGTAPLPLHALLPLDIFSIPTTACNKV